MNPTTTTTTLSTPNMATNMSTSQDVTKHASTKMDEDDKMSMTTKDDKDMKTTEMEMEEDDRNNSTDVIKGAGTRRRNGQGGNIAKSSGDKGNGANSLTASALLMFVSMLVVAKRTTYV